MKYNQEKSKLTDLQFEVTQNGATEPPFQNQYWDNKKEGIYLDIVTKEPLFCSLDKYDSGSGWPSFFRAIDDQRFITRNDYKLMQARIELVSQKGETHLGHLFDDGPEPTGKRYCINSASLEFVPLDEMEQRGYGEYLELFYQQAIFAAGCFWGVQEIFRKIEGVVSSVVGYIGGELENPEYEDVCSGDTGHAEAILVTFNPQKVSYEKLLNYFWRLHDPTTLDRQGADVGSQYRSAVFYTSEEQRKIAEHSKQDFDASGVFKNKAVTEISAASTFYPAEKYHQEYYQKNPGWVCHRLREK